jgi:hypothetical protein
MPSDPTHLDARDVPRPVRLQQVLLLELLEPPMAGDFVEQLAWRIGEPPADADQAADQLVEKGLATRQGDFLAASRAALELDQLWPLAL